MNYRDWIAKKNSLHISNYIKISHKIKTLTKEQKVRINKGLNINV